MSHASGRTGKEGRGRHTPATDSLRAVAQFARSVTPLVVAIARLIKILAGL